MCFRKKVDSFDLYDDRKCLLLSSQEMDIISELDYKNRFVNEILDIKNQLKYLSPRKSLQVYQFDLKIKDKISDLRLCLNKDGDTDEQYVKGLFMEIRVLIKERDAKELK